MSGKKRSKKRITLGFACNADRSEKLKIFFIGNSAVPVCFNQIPPEDSIIATIRRHGLSELVTCL